jgi:hypothetical protein
MKSRAWINWVALVTGLAGWCCPGGQGAEGGSDADLAVAEASEGGEVELVSMKELKWRSGVYYRGEEAFSGVGIREEDGVIRQRLDMKDGVFHGVTREWNEEGVQITETNWKEGVRHGKNTYWNPDGSLQKVQVYEEGKEVSVEHFPAGGGE